MKKSELVKRHLKLVEIKTQLKSNLFGIDAVIDQVVDSISSWYFFPKNQTRPLIINLWGMTGVGKSDLVRQLVTLLDFENDFFQFDMGEIGLDSATNLRGILSDSVQIKGSVPRIILLDEFQHCRSINESRNEVKQKEMRLVWQLLDNGKVSFMDSNIHCRRKINSMISNLEYWIKEGMTIESGMVAADYFGFFEKDEDDRDFESFSDKPFEFVFEKKYLKTIWEVNRKRFPQLRELRKHIQELDTQGVQNLLLDSLALTTKPLEMDFSQSLVFVVGNLDEAYEVSKDQSPDISPNDFHRITSEIKMPEIKMALLNRFRPEQIARLGNNHIIYASLNEHAFSCIIDFELEKIAKSFNEKTELKLTFGNSLKEWIYQEGVIATQGVRPLKSSIKYGLEDLIPQIILKYSVLEKPIDNIHLRYEEGKLEVNYYFLGKPIAQQNLKINEKQKCLKGNRKDDLQALVAVHESGHAIANMAFFGEYPEKIKSVAAGVGVGGFISSNPISFFNYDLVKKRIGTLLGGYFAEKEIFGSEFISEGASSDIKKATNLCMTVFKECGFSGTLIRTTSTTDDFENYYHHVGPVEEKVVAFIENAQREIEQILRKEKKLLIQMSRLLADQTTLDKNEIIDLVSKFGSEMLQATLKAESKGYRERLYSIEYSLE